MLIRKIVLKNFRQYYNENSIFLSTSESKNVTIIRGENGVGKTAMLNAIKWAFFGTFTDNFRNPTDLINNTAVAEGIKSCSVEIEFEEDNQLFHLIRRFDGESKKNELKLFNIDEGTFSASLPEPDLVINGMLPREMGEYFFFQGEGSNAVTAGNSSGNIGQAIRDIMGFKVASQLTETLKKLLNDNRRRITNEDTSGESTRLNNDLEKVEGEIDRIIRKLNDINIKIPVLEKDLKATEQKLSKLSNYNLRSLKEEEANIKTKLARKIQDRDVLRAKRLSLINKYGWSVFGVKLANKSRDFINESELKGKLPEPYNKQFIERILTDKKCICGACLEHGSSAYESIISMLSKAANPALQQRLKGIVAQISSISTLYEGAADEIFSINKYYDDAEEEVLLLERNLESVNEKIFKIPEDEIVKLQRLANKLDDDVKMYYSHKGDYEGRLRSKESEKVTLTLKLEKLVGSTSVISDLKIKEEFLNEIRNYLHSYLDKTEKNIRLHVLSKVNETLSNFSRHDFKIKVDPDSFKFYLLDKEDRPVGQGDGLNLLLNLTITASLIQFAAEQKKINDPILTSATIAPLIIDAPFGVLDNKYRDVVVSLLPKYANQIIFLVSSSQWTEEMDLIIRDKIGKEYILILEETSAQRNRTIDIVKVKGVEHAVSRYECEVDRTLIKEVSS